MKVKQLGLRVLSTAAIMSIVTSIAAPAFADIYYLGELKDNESGYDIKVDENGNVTVNGVKDTSGFVTIRGGTAADYEDSVKESTEDKEETTETEATTIGESEPVTQEAEEETPDEEVEEPVAEEEQPKETEEAAEEPKAEEEAPAEDEEPKEEASEEETAEEQAAEEAGEKEDSPAPQITDDDTPLATPVNEAEPVVQNDDDTDTKETFSDKVIRITNNFLKDVFNITLENVKIDKSNTGACDNTSDYYAIKVTQQGDAAMSVDGAGDTTINLKGDNELRSGAGRAGLEKNDKDTFGTSNSGTLTITAEDTDSGKLTAVGGLGGAGIGGKYRNGTSNITIDGGTIDATGYGGAGIGSGEGYSRYASDAIYPTADNITINDGKINAVSKTSSNASNYNNEKNEWECGAAIGGGYDGNATVNINGGDITVSSEYAGSAAIGKGYGGKDGTTVTITGGSVTASGKGPAIGDWYDFNQKSTVNIDLKKDFTLKSTDGASYSSAGAISAGNITINGSEGTKLTVISDVLTAIGGRLSRITVKGGNNELISNGSGKNALNGQTININGGKLTATAKNGDAISTSVSSSYMVDDKTISITDGEVTASGKRGLSAGIIKITGGKLEATGTAGAAISGYGNSSEPASILIKDTILDLTSNQENVISAYGGGSNLDDVNENTPAILRVRDADGNITKVMHNRAYIKAVYGIDADHYVTDDTTDITSATCTANGKKVERCVVCDEIVSEETLTALGHEFNVPQESSQNVTATCTDGGKQMMKCSRCDETNLVDTEKNPTNHANHGTHIDESTVVAATCEADGYTGDLLCDGCNKKVADGTIIDKLGHAYGEWEVTTPATCTEAGEETRVCAKDESHIETREIEATGHHYVDTVVAPTETEQGYTEHVCEDCGDSYRDNYTDPTGPAADENAVTAPELWVTAPDTIRQVFHVTQSGTTRTYTSPYNSGTLTGTMEILQYLQEQGVETIVFTTNQRTSRFAVADLLALVNEGDVFYLSHMDANEPTLLVVTNDHTDLLG